MAKSKFTPEQQQRTEDAVNEAVQAGVIPWQREWSPGGPRNFVTGKPYNGMLNVLPLSAIAGLNGWPDDWAGAGQISKAGGKVSADAKPTYILAPITRTFTTKDEETGKDRTITYVKGFRDVKVYNAAQADGVTVPERGENTDDPVAAADAMIAAMPLAPAISHGGSSAFYDPAGDAVRLPTFEQFHSAAAYYAAAFHELAHSTGAAKRLNRPGVADFDRFGSHQYAAEELVAEMAAAHLSALCGLDRIAPSAAYIAHWSKFLSDGRDQILTAMELAADAVRWVEGTHHKAKALIPA